MHEVSVPGSVQVRLRLYVRVWAYNIIIVVGRHIVLGAYNSRFTVKNMKKNPTKRAYKFFHAHAAYSNRYEPNKIRQFLTGGNPFVHITSVCA